MPRTGWTPSLVPFGADQTVWLYLTPQERAELAIKGAAGKRLTYRQAY
jgi:hypothetical protein